MGNGAFLHENTLPWRHESKIENERIYRENQDRKRNLHRRPFDDRLKRETFVVFVR